MMINKLPDTPWHVGFAKKEEEDPRRHRARCVHYNAGDCKHIGGKCRGSAHCKHYSEDDKERHKNLTYGYHHNEVWFSDKIKKFCHDSTQPARWKYLRDINDCPICGGKFEKYEPLKYMSKLCPKCKVLFVNQDVYVTYTDEINKNLARYLLCLVGIKAPHDRPSKPKKR